VLTLFLLVCNSPFCRKIICKGTMGLENVVEAHPFPTLGLMPKQETQALQFLEAHPSFDGRDIVVAILDTGVDPGALGLQETSDGKQKVINIIDCTGSGDVSIQPAESVKDEDGGTGESIKLLSGKVFTPPAAWKNPDGKWGVGLKRAFELFPKPLKERVKKERKKAWDEKQGEAEAVVRREIQALKDATAKASPPPNSPDGLKLQDLEEKLKQLQECDKTYDDPGPILDCIVWNDGQDWCAVVGVASDDGENALPQQEPMLDFQKKYQHRRFGEVDSFNYGIHIHDEGKILSIVVDAGAHGTHVAGIVSAFYPDAPECNGVAPGAQIVSLKIGDSRLGSMETGAGLIRAMAEAVRLKVDVINMSYGEAIAICNTGRFISLAEEIVNKHNIMFICSAGNNGPALATVGSPGGTTTAVMGIGACVSPAMMESSYSMRSPLELGTNFTWSSPGPSPAGEWGVSIMAPGAAITCVPNWTLQKKQLMNGTSMSSPNACGNVALLLCALKSKGQPRTPHRVRRAIENTASKMEGVEDLVQGHGMLQVLSAWDYLQQYISEPTEDMLYKVTSGKLGGVYLREISQLSQPSEHTITIKPFFHEDELNEKRIQFEQHIHLTCSSDWVMTPSSLALAHSGRSFVIKVDPTSLSSGAHFTVIKGFDTATPGRGPVFEVPVTIIKPQAVPSGGTLDLGNMTFTPGGPGGLKRAFVTPPVGSQWMDVTVKDCRHELDGAEDSNRRLMILHCLQMVPHTPYRDVEDKNYLRLSPGQLEVRSARIVGSTPLEISVGQFWSTMGSTELEVSVSFRGVIPSPDVLALGTGCGHAKVLLRSPLQLEDISPSAKLDKWQTKIAPTTAVISPLGERDVLPDQRQIYQLVLEYTVTQADAGEITPRFLPLNGHLYEGSYGAQQVMLFDSNKKLLGVSDCWPTAIKCPKGDNIARLQIRHSDAALLKHLTATPLTIERALSKKEEVSISAYQTIDACQTKGQAFGSVQCPAGCTTVAIFGEPPHDKLPKGVKPGDHLLGTAAYVKAKAALPGDGKRPRGYRVSFAVGPAAKKDKDKGANKADADPAQAEKSDREKFDEAIRDAKVSKLKDLAGKDVFQEIFDQLKGEYPDHLPLLQLAIQHESKKEGSDPAAIISAAEAVLGVVDLDALARHFGRNVPKAKQASPTS
ncbi:unnamed protein product, partial [Chrysoparadoxa australica]